MPTAVGVENALSETRCNSVLSSSCPIPVTNGIGSSMALLHSSISLKTSNPLSPPRIITSKSESAKL
tara:strand:+ start:2307 stop:2507 length:201 start_codon:yes stop_codon:yes gene_type:complete